MARTISGKSAFAFLTGAIALTAAGFWWGMTHPVTGDPAPAGAPTKAVRGARPAPAPGKAAGATPAPAAMLIVPSATVRKEAGTVPGGGSWARGLARLVAREAVPALRTMAVVQVLDVEGTVRYALGNSALEATGAQAVFQRYQVPLVAGLHLTFDGGIVDVVATLWKPGQPAPMFSKRYPWTAGSPAEALDGILDDLLAAAAAEPGLATGKPALPRGKRFWSRPIVPAALEAFLQAIDLQTLMVGANGRKLAGTLGDPADLLRAALAADARFAPAKVLLDDPDHRFDAVLISERKIVARKPGP